MFSRHGFSSGALGSRGTQRHSGHAAVRNADERAQGDRLGWVPGFGASNSQPVVVQESEMLGEKIGEGKGKVTAQRVLPNPSGLNAHYRPKELAEVFGELHEAVRSGATARPRAR